MKIVCDNCATKYQIADEKVSGKAFKIRCKKCSHIIVVNKGGGEASSAGQQVPDGAAAQDAPAAAAEPAAGTDSVWHLVIDREQVGPMTADEVRGKVKAGQADADTYGWKEGFDDWLKLSAIDEFKADFAGKAGDAQATRKSEPAERQAAASEPAASPGADLFGGAAPARNEPAVRAASPAAATLMADSAAGLGSYEPHNTSAGDMGGGQSMKGARSENSVLFSLNNLSALAGPSGDAGGSSGSSGSSRQQDKPGYAHAQSEASGLIDIRAMAAATLSTNNQGSAGMNRGPDILMGGDIAPVFAPVATNVLIPTAEPQGVPKWVFGLVAVGGLMIVGMIVFLVIYLQSPTQPVVATGPTTGVGATVKPETPTTNPGPGTTVGTSATDSATKTTPAANTTKTTEPATKPSTPAETGSGSSKSGKSKGEKPAKGDKPEKGDKPAAKAEKEPDIAPPPPKADPPKPKAPAKAKDDLDSLLDTASSGSGGKPSAAAKKDLPEQLSMSEIKGALKNANVGPCKDQGASGTYMVKLTIGRNGKVSDANVTGAGADCVSKAVKATKFPEFSGDPISLTYPFIVR